MRLSDFESSDDFGQEEINISSGDETDSSSELSSDQEFPESVFDKEDESALLQFEGEGIRAPISKKSIDLYANALEALKNRETVKFLDYLEQLRVEIYRELGAREAKKQNEDIVLRSYEIFGFEYIEKHYMQYIYQAMKEQLDSLNANDREYWSVLASYIQEESTRKHIAYSNGDLPEEKVYYLLACYVTNTVSSIFLPLSKAECIDSDATQNVMLDLWFDPKNTIGRKRRTVKAEGDTIKIERMSTINNLRDLDVIHGHLHNNVELVFKDRLVDDVVLQKIEAELKKIHARLAKKYKRCWFKFANKDLKYKQDKVDEAIKNIDAEKKVQSLTVEILDNQLNQVSHDVKIGQHRMWLKRRYSRFFVPPVTQRQLESCRQEMQSQLYSGMCTALGFSVCA